jgi:hypothetical protein
MVMDRMARWIAVLLKAARAINAVTATLSILVVGVGLLVALYFESVIWKGPDYVAVPPEARATALAIGPAAVDNRLKPPDNVRIAITRPVIDGSLKRQDILGYFQADTANGLARFPEGVDILGGKDSELFDRRDGGSQGIALIPTQALIDQVKTTLTSDQAQLHHDFSLVVVARDSYGIPSVVSNTGFALTYARGSAGPATNPPPQQPSTTTRPMSELERLARDIALAAVGQEDSPAYRTAFDRALREPVVCGTSQEDSEFVANYRRIFDHARPQLTATNLPALFDGICDEWRKAAAGRARMLRESEVARNAAISANQNADYRYAFQAASAWAARNLTLVVVGGALSVFTVICLVLAFLALENHSNAMREAMAVIAQLRRNEDRP